MPTTPDPDILSKIALFRGLTSEQLSGLDALLQQRTFPAGTHIITAEQPGESAYIILKGSVKPTSRSPAAPRSSSLSSGRPRSWAR